MVRLLKVVAVIIVGSALLVYISGCNVKRKAIKMYAIDVKKAPYDAVIVPGVQYDSTQTNKLLIARVYWAKYLFDQGITKNIIFSGAAVRTNYIEGRVMKMMADSLGMPPAHTFSEEKAQHSVENIYLGNKMAKKLGFKKVALATDPFQSFMLGSFIKKYAPNMGRLPLNSDTLYAKPMPNGTFLSARVDSFVSIDKRMTFFQRLHASFSIDTAKLNKE